MNKLPHFAFAIFVFFAVFASFLLAPVASAHHVLGFELSPAFELLHGFIEPFFFAGSGASLAWFLRYNAKKNNAGKNNADKNNIGKLKRSGRFASTPFRVFCFSTLFALLLAMISLLESIGAGAAAVFLLYDMVAFAVIFGLVAKLWTSKLWTSKLWRRRFRL